MPEMTPVVRTIKEIRSLVAEWKKDGLRVGLVPTMGALHHGHLSLVDAISEHTDRIIVSIFVNPTQFGAHEDLDQYPRQEAADREKLATTHASVVFAPTVEEMYPSGHTTRVTLDGLSEILEGANRIGHFDGVATIVSKLFMQCQPDVAIFGEKDYQQLAVIRQFTQDLDIPVEILGGKLIREKDGLAASSRNAYLSEKERKIAGSFNIILKDLVTKAEQGSKLRTIEAEASEALLAAGFTAVDYVSIVHKDTLLEIDEITEEARVVSVARLGDIRLLDNMAIKAP